MNRSSNSGGVWSRLGCFPLGQEEVAEHEAKALAAARNVFGPDVADLRAAKPKLDLDPRNRLSRSEVLALVGDALARARTAAARRFARVPAAPLSVLPYSDLEGLSHPDARYQPAARDGSRPARYRIDVTNPDGLKRAGLENTAFHEGIPGHHLQMQIAREHPGGHELGDITGLGTFIEGWARYAEGLADEMGLYSSDPDRLGLFAHLPTGLVVDPGTHALGWTRERAIAYVMAKQLVFSAEAAAAYVDRMAVMPGRMVSYGAGELAIRRLRARAEAELGARAFHAIVLSRGAITVPMLSELVGHWITAEKQSSREHRSGARRRATTGDPSMCPLRSAAFRARLARLGPARRGGERAVPVFRREQCLQSSQGRDDGLRRAV